MSVMPDWINPDVVESLRNVAVTVGGIGFVLYMIRALLDG